MTLQVSAEAHMIVLSGFLFEPPLEEERPSGGGRQLGKPLLFLLGPDSSVIVAVLQAKRD